MGIKSSMITIRLSHSPAVSDRLLLDSLGYTDYTLTGETTLEECMYPRDKSINIGLFNNHLIICDDFQCTEALDALRRLETLSDYEQVLTSLFPQSEILSTACHSVVNYHVYALIQGAVRQRFKRISSEDTVSEYGEQLAEEIPLYAQSKVIDGRRLFKDAHGGPDDGYEYTEDQLMEDFTFGVAKRHLGVKLTSNEDETLMFHTPFKKYKHVKSVSAGASSSTVASTASTPPVNNSWFGRLFGRKK